MNTNKFAVGYDGYVSDTFPTYAEALSAAKRLAKKRERDTEVWTIKSTVKFPEPDYEVVEATDDATAAA